MHRVFAGALLGLSILGAWSCGVPEAEDEPRQESPTRPATASSLAGDPGEIDLKPNVIKATATLTNQNPEILSLLATDPWHTDGQAWATSTAPTGYNATTTQLTFSSPTKFTFELLVEAAAGGADGVVYSVGAMRGNTLLTQLEGVRVKPHNLQPQPTEVELEDCLGVVQVFLAKDESCKTPATGLGMASIYSLDSYYTPSTGLVTAYVPERSSKTTLTSDLVYTVKTSIGEVLVKDTVSWSNLRCDQVIRSCKVVREPVVRVGDINGPFDVLGESLTYQRYVGASWGPSGFSGQQFVWGSDLTAPIQEPAKWWRISNLLEGSYNLYAISSLRRGRQFTTLHVPGMTPYTPAGPVTVEAGKNLTSSRVINGEVRYPLVMTPAFFHGSIRLADPFMPNNPGASSTLQSLTFGSDYDSNGDGIPNNPSDFRTRMYAYAPGGGHSMTSFPGRFEPGTGELASTYEQVLAGAYDLPHVWYQSGLELHFWSQGESTSTRPGLYDRDRFRSGVLTLQTRDGHDNSASMGPGDRHRMDHAYCFNELKLLYRTELGRFINPRVDVSGTYKGVDWRGQTVDYYASGSFDGDPYVSGYPVRDSDPSSQSHLSLTLPQGTFTLQPRATLVSDSGATSTATFAPLGLTTGCGQRLNIVPPLVVLIDPLNRCSSGATARVTGKVKSLPLAVDRLSYQVNGGPRVTLCTNCGVEPTFAFDAPLGSCENTVQVFAENSALPEPAAGSQQIVWDDPSDGPSCPNAACANHAPVARCHDIVVPAGTSCTQGCGSVDDGSYDPDPGDTVRCTQGPECPYALGTRTVTLTCRDNTGNTSSCNATVTVRDMDPPVITCPAAPVLACVDGGAKASFAPTAQDACGTVTTTCSPAPGSTLPLGTTSSVCTATDAAGNHASCAFDVTVRDDAPPQLQLLGNAALTLRSGVDSYVEPGFRASDVCSGDLTSLVRVSGTVDPSVPGHYTLTYSVTDSAGLSATATRVIDVVKDQGPDPDPGPVCGSNPGHFTATAHGTSALHLQHSATALPDGRVLVVGGFMPSAELYDSTSGTWTSTGAPRTNHRLHTATLLQDGRVLVAGGDGASPGDPAEVYEPLSGTWSATGGLLTHRREHAAVRLADGRVLVMGGTSAEGTPLSSAELYEPATGRWSSTSGMAHARRAFSATLLQDGRVLVAGGLVDDGDECTGTNCLGSAEVYDPRSGTWSPTGGMARQRGFHAALRLADGRVLVSGGGVDGPDSATAELYDPATGTWTATGDMGSARRRHSLTPLPNGQVLAIGGYDAWTGIHASAELYTLATGTWCPTGSMGQPRYEHTATPLPDGRVLVTAGFSTASQYTAEVYGW